MQKIEIPEILNDVKHKIEVLEQRFSLVQTGLDLYTDLAQKETDKLQQFLYQEQAAKKREELIVYSQQIRSQKVYLAEFEKDLKQQKALRQKQLGEVKQHLPAMLKKAKQILKSNKSITEQDRTLLTEIRQKLLANKFSNESDKIINFRELVKVINNYT